MTCRLRGASRFVLPFYIQIHVEEMMVLTLELQVGVIVGLISTSLQAIGLTLQRKSHLLEDEKDPWDVRRPAYKRKRWQV